ncbi:MAG: hypothetical protein ABIQ16_14110 [Polyangiaceae bacterium]
MDQALGGGPELGGATAGSMPNASAAGGGVAGVGGLPDDGGSPPITVAGGGTSGGAGPIPSPGCALANADVPKVEDFTEAKLTAQLVAPASYDGVTPLPLLFMLHATNQETDYLKLTGDPAITQRYLVAAPRAPNSSSGSFESLPPILTTQPIDTLATVLAQLLATHCIDERRVFGVGNGSGGRALMSWIVTHDKATPLPPFRAVAIVGTYYGRLTWQPTPLLFLHPLLSNNSRAVASDADGMKAFGIFAAANSCGAATTEASMMGCQAGGMAVEPGCWDIGGCAAPLRFCHHDGPDQAGDAWPCFGTAAIAQFFEPYLQ